MQAAYGKDGQPTKALTGFANKNGVDVGEVTREADAKGTEYVWAVRKQAGRPAAEVGFLNDKSPLADELIRKLMPASLDFRCSAAAASPEILPSCLSHASDSSVVFIGLAASLAVDGRRACSLHI